jgi:GrpB-like predicted nucleotidyltransferase (UPF0157 family)
LINPTETRQLLQPQEAAKRSQEVNSAKRPQQRSPLGLARGTAVVRDYDPRWAAAFDAESAVLRSVLGDAIDGVEHIGSTAVPGLAAKPVLDIAVALSHESQVGRLRDALENSGYAYRGDLGDDGGLVFAKGPESARTVYLHVLLPAQSDQWRKYLVFRDALRRFPALRDRYSTLKKDLAARFPSSREGYVRGKHDFIRESIGRYADRIEETRDS